MFPRLALVAAVLISLGFHAALGQTPLGTGFTYQGRLQQSGQPFDGSASLEFRLFDAASGGNLLGTQTLSGVGVSAGLFTVILNNNGEFGANAFNGASRWLEVAVNGTTLAPRQAVTAAPNALFSSSATDSTQLDGQPAAFYQDATNILSGVLADPRLSANVPLKNASNAFGTFNNTFAGSVGVNTAAPANRLHVVAGFPGDGIRLTGGPGADPGFQLFNGLTPGGGLGLAVLPGTWSVDAASGDLVLRSNGGKNLMLQSGPFSAALTITGVNNVGIGTISPAAKLDVRGDIRLGASGQYIAPAGEESLRIIRGVFSGAGGIIVGSGFSIAHTSTGHYTVTFASAFTGPPAVTVTADNLDAANPAVVTTNGVTASAANLVVGVGGFGAVDRPVHFIAIGPR